jgi:diguanylate cyclase (GGDEF)-like protein
MKKISFLPKSVVLNYESKVIGFDGTLKYKGNEKPLKVWLLVHFFSPLSNVEEKWTYTIKLVNYLKDRNEIEIYYKIRFENLEIVPTTRPDWYAKFNVSDISEDDVFIDIEKMGKSIDGAIKVVVIEARMSDSLKNKIKVKDPYRLKGTLLADQYHLEDYLGGGGMGAVYLATQKDSDKLFAVKILKPDVAARSPEYIQLFEEEIAKASKLSHPNIVRIFDSGIEDDISFMVMELLEGQTLEDEVNQKGKLEIDIVKNIFRQICNAFIYAHSRNIIHLDITPRNIFILSVPKDGNFIKVIDFGLAKLLSSESGTTVTKFQGTHQYCSPEHFGGKFTHRSDIYSLGAVLYNLLTGVVPFGTSYIYAKMQNVELPPIPSILNQRKDLPEKINFVIQKALSKKPVDRQESVQQLLQEFEEAFLNPLQSNNTDKPLTIITGHTESLKINRLENPLLFDGVTELPNQHYLEKRLVEELTRSNRNGYPISFMLIDVDNLHSHNKKYGLNEGNKVLKFIAQRLQETIHSEGIVVRGSGDEFWVLLFQKTSAEAEIIAENLRNQIAETTDFLKPTITVSIGIASWSLKMN